MSELYGSGIDLDNGVRLDESDHKQYRNCVDESRSKKHDAMRENKMR